MICDEMRKLREILDKRGIEWEDASATGHYPVERTHFDYNGCLHSVVHGYGSYGGYDSLGADMCLLELYSSEMREPIGYLTAEEVEKIVFEDEVEG